MQLLKIETIAHGFVGMAHLVIVVFNAFFV
jgi:hypothetical protein